MPLGTQAKQLWKRSRPFRFTTIAAGVVTVLAVVSGLNGGGLGNQGNNPNNQVVSGGGNSGGGGSSSGGSGSGGSGGSGSGGGGSGGGANQPPNLVKCGPGGNTQLAAPLVQGSTQPRNVTAVQPTGNQQQTGVPLEVVGRFNQFFVTVDAAKAEPRRGESCALMSDAIGILEATDYAYATCFQDGQSKLTDAQACALSHGQSEARYDRLLSAHDAFKAEPSSANIAALAQAQSDMRDYDKARERWRQVTPIVSEAQAATASIVESDMRIGRLVAAHNAAKTGGVAEIEALATASGLSQLDIARLTSEQEDMLEEARVARADVQDSDTRLDTLAVAVQSIVSGNSETRADLIAAVGALTPFDAARASPEQRATITRAKSEAARFALDDLLEEARGLNLATASAEQHQRLVDLASVVIGHGGVTQPTPEQNAALLLSQEADAALTRSDRRLAAMTSTMEAVRDGGPSAINEDVPKSFDAITDFDQERMDEVQRADFADLSDANEVYSASADEVLTRSVPIFVSAEGEGPTSDALETLREGLQRDGFNIVDTREASAVHLTMRVGEMRERENTFGGTTVKTARIDLGLNGEWTIGDEDLITTSVEGIGRGRNAPRQALERSVDELLQAIRDVVERG